MLNLCECGCGQPTRLASKTASKRGWIKGQPLRFINGHNNVYEGKENSKIAKACIVCGNEFKVWPSVSEALCCSNDCGRVITAGKLRSEEGHIRKTSGGYLQIKINNHPYLDGDGYVMYHRHVLESYYNMFISKEYDVHHIDEDKTNNDLSNLAILARSEHMSLHAMQREGFGVRNV